MLRTLRLGLSLLLIHATVVVYGQTQPDEASKAVKTVVQAIRNNQDDKAISNFDTEGQSQFMLGSYWATGTLVQRQEFMKLFNSLFARIAFPKIRENFKNLATLTYDNPVINGNEATINSVATINHPIKTQEMKLKYTMSRQQKWKVVDVAVMGASMLADLRDAQIQPLLKQGGWDKLLKAMRDKEAEMNKLR